MTDLPANNPPEQFDDEETQALIAVNDPKQDLEKVDADFYSCNTFLCCGKNKNEKKKEFAPFQKMFSDEKIQQRSLSCLRIAVLVDAINGAILQPNYPIMVIPEDQGGDEDSFPSTSPFDFNSATYFLPMSALLGVAIASLVMGNISDRIGRKPCILFCLYGSVAGQIFRFFMKFNFWAFCGASLLNGLMSATLPVALAYIGDISRNPKEKEQEFGLIVGFFMLGNSGGGIIAILMQTTGLFTPLWVGAATLLLAAIYSTFALVESKEILALKEKQTKLLSGEEGGAAEADDDSEAFEAPTTVDKKSLTLIILGSLADNIGSVGLTRKLLQNAAVLRIFKTELVNDVVC